MLRVRLFTPYVGSKEMSNSSEILDLSYPEKPDSNGYAKKYYKRRAFYFGAHNSPESFVLFGEWKRRLVESGVVAEVKSIRKEMSQHALASPHFELGDTLARKPWQLTIVTAASAMMILGAVLAGAKILSSSVGPTVDGITLTNEEIDFIRGIRMHQRDFVEDHATLGERVADLTMRLMEEGPDRAKSYLQTGI
jgi:hypothetical protein